MSIGTKYKDSSNYSQTKMNSKYLELYDPNITLDTLSDDTREIIINSKYHKRPDLMAHDMYGNSRVWWLFAHYNRKVLKDPLHDFIAGTKIVIPIKYRPGGS
tara:strand:- start:789 stop:1094 length:306 start_codon:yes stop_codon:yes gene_type:complete